VQTILWWRRSQNCIYPGRREQNCVSMFKTLQQCFCPDPCKFWHTMKGFRSYIRTVYLVRKCNKGNKGEETFRTWISSNLRAQYHEIFDFCFLLNIISGPLFSPTKLSLNICCFETHGDVRIHSHEPWSDKPCSRIWFQGVSKNTIAKHCWI
jgi:hypothetical protein